MKMSTIALHLVIVTGHFLNVVNMHIKLDGPCLPPTLRKSETVKLFKHKIWEHFFNEQLNLNSFST